MAILSSAAVNSFSIHIHRHSCDLLNQTNLLFWVHGKYSNAISFLVIMIKAVGAVGWLRGAVYTNEEDRSRRPPLRREQCQNSSQRHQRS